MNEVTIVCYSQKADISEIAKGAFIVYVASGLPRIGRSSSLGWCLT